ncbi:MAG: MFS transporter, partial [Anaerolineae bacterium]|nr:MFS transporter [Anaerolineae bacterium]
AKAFVADLVQRDQRGTAYGWFNGAIGLAALPASLLAGLLWQGVAVGPAWVWPPPFCLVVYWRWWRRFCCGSGCRARPCRPKLLWNRTRIYKILGILRINICVRPCLSASH